MAAKRKPKNLGELKGRRGASRPFRDLLLQLPLLAVDSDGAIDYDATEPALLVQIAANGTITMETIQFGTWAIGKLLAYSAAEAETREISGDAIDALGLLLSELSEFAAFANAIATQCRKHTVDYAPRTVKIIPNVRIWSAAIAG